MNFNDEPLSLVRIREELIKMEDTIIFCKELASMPVMGEGAAKVRRYTSPDEYPFSKSLPAPVLPPLSFPKILVPNDINLNDKLKSIYINELVPRICKAGDDLNYGSAATKDTEALQMLSRRIHFGKFVAEAKFQDPKYHDEYVRLIKARDSRGIEDLLTNKAVEERVLRRLRKKAMIYGQEIEDDSTQPQGSSEDKPFKLPLDVVTNLYEKFVIPLTKEVEVEYLLIRLDHPDFKPEIRT
ncbi:chorismate mutase aro7 [Phlyctochytrium bullatum]|nr:chorismate mutase aro7 [Phlyctochytrium bullatum]